jgi:hypothetical protein
VRGRCAMRGRCADARALGGEVAQGNAGCFCGAMPPFACGVLRRWLLLGFLWCCSGICCSGKARQRIESGPLAAANGQCNSARRSRLSSSLSPASASSRLRRGLAALSATGRM